MRRRIIGGVALLVALSGVGVLLIQRHGPAHAAAAGVTQMLRAAPATAGAPSSQACRPGVTSVTSVADSSAPDGRRSVWIHRPAGPDRASIPVLYLLHGYPGDPSEIVDSSLPRVLDEQMCRTGKVFVMAAPDGRYTDVDTEWGDDAAGRFALEAFVTRTAINLVEGAFPRAARLRAIGGFSMGGYGAAALALRHPGEYRQVAAFGGYYHVDDPAGVFGGGEPPAHAPDQLVSFAKGQRYFLVEGTDEDTPLMRGSIKGEAERFAALLRGEDVAVDTALPPGGHGDSTWYPELGAMADFLDAGWFGS